MERDDKALVYANQATNALNTGFQVGGPVIGAATSCGSTVGLGCAAAIGMAVKGLIEALIGATEETLPTQVADPDDYMGTNLWVITRDWANYRTSGNGAYAFYLPEVPTKVEKLGPPSLSATEMTQYATMRVRPHFCLYREGIPDSEVKKVCAPSQIVAPWPMDAQLP